MRIAFPTDEHFPYQDDAARAVALKIVEDFNPDIRISGSDGLDFYSLSKFDKDPARIKGLQTEIDKWKAGQREWQDASPNAVVQYLQGNHEDRLPSYLKRHPELYGLNVLKIENLLDFDGLGITKRTDYSEFGIPGVVVFKHGSIVRGHSAFSAKGEIEKEFFCTPVVTGHTHRGGKFFASTRKGIVQAVEAFCLCRLDPGYIKNPNWQQGIVLAEIVNNILAIEDIPIFTLRRRKVAVWRGKEYRN